VSFFEFVQKVRIIITVSPVKARSSSFKTVACEAAVCRTVTKIAFNEVVGMSPPPPRIHRATRLKVSFTVPAAKARSSSFRADACEAAVWRTVVKIALNAVDGIFTSSSHVVNFFSVSWRKY
jgi:hypothetical protein